MAKSATRTFGAVRVDAILDGQTTFEVQPDESRVLAGPAEDDELDEGRWIFRVWVFLIRTPRITVLFDAGIGPAATPLARQFGSTGLLLDALERLGISPDDIDAVVVSHHHDDHVGWLSTDAGVFTDAAVYFGHDEESQFGSTPEYYRDCVFAPLTSRRGSERVKQPVAIDEGLTILPTPGHSPGHLALELVAGDDILLFTADIVHFYSQLQPPFRSGPFDEDPDAAMAARTSIMTRHPRFTLAAAHLPEPFVAIEGG